jgi:hypothetical protein
MILCYVCGTVQFGIHYRSGGTPLLVGFTDSDWADDPNDRILMQVLKADQSRKKGYLGKEGMHDESDNWKEEKHTRMHGIPNNVRVRVLAIHYNGQRARNV